MLGGQPRACWSSRPHRRTAARPETSFEPQHGRQPTSLLSDPLKPREDLMKHLCISAMFAASLCGSLAACTDKTDADYKADIVTAMHDSIADDLDAMVVAGLNLQAAAPNRAWNATRDAD